MPEPTVCAVMLTRDRPEYARRAVEAFRAQTYPNKRLLIFNTGDHSLEPLVPGESEVMFGAPPQGWGIGHLRNEVNRLSRPGEILIHFDDDDWSHPNRIAEQVALLQGSGADVVGYREMLFWCTRTIGPVDVDPMERAMPVQEAGEAYLYFNPAPTYCLGTSLCYWRKTWERKPFSERNGPNPRERGEDREFLRSVKSLGVRANNAHLGFMWDTGGRFQVASQPDGEPRMIARIHAGNARHYDMDELVKNSDSWRRVPEWDDHCRTIMEAK